MSCVTVGNESTLKKIAFIYENVIQVSLYYNPHVEATRLILLALIRIIDKRCMRYLNSRASPAVAATCASLHESWASIDCAFWHSTFLQERKNTAPTIKNKQYDEKFQNFPRQE